MRDKIKEFLKKILPAYRVALRVEKKLDASMIGKFRYIPKPMLTFEVHLAEHCNLNCAYCTHFSPLAEPEFLEPESFEKDVKKLSELFNGEMQFIKLLGGEPLLNPKVTEFMRIAREYFPVGHILLVTNGILLPEQPEDFWLACREYDVWITPTYYPCKIDYKASEALANQYGIRYMAYNDYINVPGGDKTMFKFILNLDGSEDPRQSFECCDEGNSCILLHNGRLYPCPESATARHFSKYFGKELHSSPLDSVDIHKAETGRALMEALAGPIPFCRYCDKRISRDGLPWRTSKKEISEWTDC